MDIFSKMGWSREDLQYRINRVWHNIKYSACAVVCAVLGIAILGGFEAFNKVFSTLLLVACGGGYIYSIMMINHHEEDEYDYIY